MQRQLRKTNSQNLENASEILVDGYKLMVKRYLSVRTYLGEKGDRGRDEAVRQQCDHVHLPHATCLPFARRTATDATRRMNPPFAACLPLTPGRRSRWAAACAGPSPSPGRRPSQAVAFARSSPQPSPSSIPILLFAPNCGSCRAVLLKHAFLAVFLASKRKVPQERNNLRGKNRSLQHFAFRRTRHW